MCTRRFLGWVTHRWRPPRTCLTSPPLTLIFSFSLSPSFPWACVRSANASQLPLAIALLSHRATTPCLPWSKSPPHLFSLSDQPTRGEEGSTPAIEQHLYNVIPCSSLPLLTLPHGLCHLYVIWQVPLTPTILPPTTCGTFSLDFRFNLTWPIVNFSQQAITNFFLHARLTLPYAPLHFL